MGYACRIRPTAGCLRKGGRMRLNREALGGMLRNGSKVGVRGVPAEAGMASESSATSNFSR